MENKNRKIIVMSITCLIIILISLIASPIEIFKHSNTFILCLNRRYFRTDRYNYMHIIGNYKIKSEFGDIFLKTGDKVNGLKGYLGTFYNINDHTINILDNDITNIEYIDIYFYDNFTIKLIQDLNIYGKIFKVKYIFLQDGILIFQVIDFPEEIILKNDYIIKLNDKNYNNVEIKIIENRIYLDINNTSVKEYYFIINNNENSYNSLKICIDNEWSKIID